MVNVKNITGDADVQKLVDKAKQVKQANTKIKKIVGDVTLNSSIESFAGMDQAKIGDFEKAVDSYEKKIVKIINGFSPKGSVDPALKGDVAEKVTEFFIEMKKLLKRYVQAIDMEIAEIHRASERLNSGEKKIASAISAETGDIKKAGGSIETDDYVDGSW